MISWGDIGGKRKPSRFTPVSPNQPTVQPSTSSLDCSLPNTLTTTEVRKKFIFIVKKIKKINLILLKNLILDFWRQQCQRSQLLHKIKKC